MLQSITTSQEFKQNRQQPMQILQIDAVVFVHFMQPLSITSGFTASNFASSNFVSSCLSSVCFTSLDIIQLKNIKLREPLVTTVFEISSFLFINYCTVLFKGGVIGRKP